MAKKSAITFNELRLGVHKGRVVIGLPTSVAKFPVSLMCNEARELGNTLLQLVKVVAPLPIQPPPPDEVTKSV